MKKTYVVIGLGKFGSAIAAQLYDLGNEVLAIDESSELVQRAEPHVTCAVVGDARDEDVLRSLGVGNYDCAIVGIGSDLATSVIVTLNLKELKVGKIICKATDEVQKRALEKVGADRVVIPEREMGVKLAQSLSSSSVLDFIELSKDYGIAETTMPEAWAGQTLRGLNVRAKYGVNIIAIKENGKFNVSPGPDDALKEGTILVVLGRVDQLSKFGKLGK